MKSKRVQALVLAMAVVVGYAGAAAFSAWAQPTLVIATDFGPDDGLTRYVVTAASGEVTEAMLADLERVPGIATAQALHGGMALVATDGMAPHHLEALPGVADAEFSPTIPLLGTITDPYFPQYGWNLENTGGNFHQQDGTADADVDAGIGWDGGTGHGRIVAVVDSGFDSDNPDLAGSLWTNPDEACGSVDTDGNGLAGDCHGWNFYTETADIDNTTLGSHGAAVSGVVGARANNGHGSAGVAPDVSIMPLVIGGGSTVDVNLGAQAIRYAVDHGADVINASWGGAFSGAPLTNLKDAVAYAAEHDVLIVAAAGNDAGDRDTDLMYPASLPDANIVTVGNSDAADTMSDSSAYGATTVDLFAPGRHVPTTWNDGGTRLVSGTSISAPHVAAAVALYRAAMPGATGAELKQALLGDVEPVPAFTGKSVTGGRLTIAPLADAALGDVRYLFASMTAPAGTVSPRITATGTAATGEYSVELGLGMEYQREVWAVADKEITLGGTTLATDDSGTAVFTLGAADSPADLDLTPSVELGDGRYLLTVQLMRDGDAAGRAFAAPLLVGTAVQQGPDSGAGDSPEPGAGDTPSDGGTDPEDTDDPASGDPAPDGTGDDEDNGSGDGPTGPGDDSATDGPGDPDDGGTTGPDDGGDDSDGSEADAPGGGDDSDGPGDQGGDGSGNSSPDAPADDDAPPADSEGGPADGPADSDDGSDTPESDAPPPVDAGPITFPGTGSFGVTSMDPAVVSTAGGTLVTITGSALPADARVRIGDSAEATVTRSTSTELVFRAPPRIAGVYDVHVFADDDRTEVLEGALTYTVSGTPPVTGPDESDDPDATDDTDSEDAPGSDEETEGPGGAAEPVVRTGPGGERLVRSTRFATLGVVFGLDCSTSCTGMAP